MPWVTEVGYAIPILTAFLCVLGEDDAVNGAFEETVCPVREKIGDVDKDRWKRGVGV